MQIIVVSLLLNGRSVRNDNRAIHTYFVMLLEGKEGERELVVSLNILCFIFIDENNLLL